MNLVRICIILLFLAYQTINAYPKRDARGEVSENYVRQQGIVDLKLPKMQYRENEPVKALLSVRNTGNEVLRIFPYGRDLRSFQVIVRDEDGRTVSKIEEEPKVDSVLRRRNRVENLVGDEVKEIILHKDETFSKEIRLDQLYELEAGKKYFVTAYFYPNISEYRDHFVRSQNHPYFSVEERRKDWILPGVPYQDPVIDGLEPEEVIHLFLGAEKKGNWKLHFKWIHFPEYVQAYDRYSRDWAQAEESEKDFILEEFRKFLTENRAGVLQYYKILSVDKINSNLAKVRVAVERRLNKVQVRYEYEFTLRRVPEETGAFWKVANLLAKVRK
ncbi:hypothetical protein LEP1GSC058_2198 [Leptospira fainei serovar Hurstbridge str. BUT 6]|uniref:Uncharacterized protein n=1 Tax=Leptospira fainei serovar Hurstbridge str. BUT 6 TaxID=1193011 RepID=S3UYP2_9LEPT|nr:hypothetical protein [Leptospira fainei]EPG75511.1 hypothetical protein LEP1GSC058_2198 [Leptospira fainei serovar Hurstbridge str. BUT 6]